MYSGWFCRIDHECGQITDRVGCQCCDQDALAVVDHRHGIGIFDGPAAAVHFDAVEIGALVKVDIRITIIQLCTRPY